jgi:hypothetical protein
LRQFISLNISPVFLSHVHLLIWPLALSLYPKTSFLSFLFLAGSSLDESESKGAATLPVMWPAPPVAAPKAAPLITFTTLKLAFSPVAVLTLCWMMFAVAPDTATEGQAFDVLYTPLIWWKISSMLEVSLNTTRLLFRSLENHNTPGKKVFLFIAEGTIPGDGEIWQIVETVGTLR